jgi:hypothetical protein
MSLFSGILLLGSTVEAGTLRVAYSAISGAWRSVGWRKTAATFKREGLDGDPLYIGGGSLVDPVVD